MLTPAEAMFVDGYDEESKTVYEFQGCFHHGCIKCFPNNRHRKTTVTQIVPFLKSMKPPVKRQRNYVKQVIQ